MKLISYNIGIKIDNSDAVAKYLLDIDADIVCLQEVVRHFDDSVYPMYHSKAIIDKYLKEKYPYVFFGPTWVTKYVTLSGGRYRDYGGYVEQGNYILSKYPITFAENIHYLYNYRLEMDHTNFEQTDHPRNVAVADIKIKDHLVKVVNIHGCYSKEKVDTKRSLNQSKFLLNLLKSETNPLLLVGDFNVAPDTKSIKMLNSKYENMMEKFGIIDLEDQSNLETRKLVDYIFTNNKITPQNLEVDNVDISDHPPFIFEFDLN